MRIIINKLKAKFIFLSIGFISMSMSFSSICYSGNTKNSSNSSNSSNNLNISFDSVAGNFIQIQSSKNSVQIKEFSGNFKFNKPNKFIWEYQKPFKQIIQSDGKKLYLYDKDLQQITTKNLDTAISSSPISLFLNNNGWNKYFTAQISSINEFNAVNAQNIISNKIERLDKNLIANVTKWIALSPKDKDSIYKNLNIGLVNNTPSILQFQDNLGNYGLIQIYDSQIKPSFRDVDFIFNAPKGVDIISE